MVRADFLSYAATFKTSLGSDFNQFRAEKSILFPEIYNQFYILNDRHTPRLTII